MLIATERLVLRRFRESDAVTLAEYRSDPAVARYQSWSPPFSLEAARALTGHLAAGDPGRPGWFQYAVELTATRTHIGDIGVNLHENRRQAEMGFTLAAAYQRRGFGVEMVSALLDHLFSVQGLHKVSAECDARNAASAALLARTGFVAEGRRRQHTWIKGEWTDDLLFGLLGADWLSSGARPGRAGRTAGEG
jgi:RimJ/RimL family protein N-acetyltransferase